MNGYLLDTNVISEIIRSAPDSRVVAFLDGRDDLWLSSIVIHELEYGVRRLPQGQRRSALRNDLSRFLTEYDDRILPLDRTAAEWAAQFRVQAGQSGLVLSLGDALIAGTTRTHELTLATRNVADFEILDLQVVNPWEASRQI